jgi:aldehyde dehydrogenase (NAD+)
VADFSQPEGRLFIDGDFCDARSEERALVRRIRTGTLSVSGGLWFGPDAPFGGHKQSGVGRKMGVEGFAEYLETRTIGLPA